MFRFRPWFLFGVICAVSAVVVVAQPPERPPQGDDDREAQGPPGRHNDDGQEGPPHRGRSRRPPNPLMEALDTNRDGVLSAEEIANAPASLKKLDKNGDGKLTPDELRPTRRRGGRGGNFGPGRDAAGPGGQDDGGPGPGRRGFGGDRGGPGPDPAGPDADGGPPGQGQFGQRGGNGQGGPGRGPGGPPSPQRLVEHAMRFDADGDGKLSRTELLNFAKDFVRHAPAGKGDAAATAAPDKMDPASADLEVGAVTVAKAPAAVRPMTISRTVRSVRIVPSDATDTSDASRPAVLHKI